MAGKSLFNYTKSNRFAFGHVEETVLKKVAKESIAEVYKLVGDYLCEKDYIIALELYRNGADLRNADYMGKVCIAYYEGIIIEQLSK